MIKETYFNQYKGWREGTKPEGEVIFIQRTKGHVLSPSLSLLEDWKNKKITWEQYVKRFLEEMKSTEAQKEIERLANLSKERDVWLVCSCWNSKKQCHRYIVKELIEQWGQQVP